MEKTRQAPTKAGGERRKGGSLDVDGDLMILLEERFDRVIR